MKPCRAITPSFAASPGEASLSIFTTLSLPTPSSESFCRIGRSARQGEHQVAVKSTSTGSGAVKTSASNVCSVIMGMVPLDIG